jgi:hypothetical protein
MRTTAALLLGSTLVFAAGEALAEAEERYPKLHGAVLIELQNDAFYHSADPSWELDDLYLTVESSFSLEITSHFSAESGLVLEPVFPPEPGQNRFFGDQGLFVEQLYLDWHRDRYSLHGGKFNPRFGIAWDAAPGIWGTDFAEAYYEITERIGLGGDVELGGERFGSHVLGVDVFMFDTSPLSDSLITPRGRFPRNLDWPGNTGTLDSFTITAQGERIPALPGLGYRLGFARFQGEGEARTQLDYAAALTYALEPRPDVHVRLLAEYVHQHDPGGAEAKRDLLTAGCAGYWRGSNLALSYSWLAWRSEAEGRIRDYLFQVTLGYAWDLGEEASYGRFAIEVGWRSARELGLRRDAAGALVSYLLEF